MIDIEVSIEAFCSVRAVFSGIVGVDADRWHLDAVDDALKCHE